MRRGSLIAAWSVILFAGLLGYVAVDAGQTTELFEVDHYEVVAGDTLTLIAGKYCPHCTDAQRTTLAGKIRVANRLATNAIINPGNVLHVDLTDIPEVPPSTTTTVAATTTTTIAATTTTLAPTTTTTALPPDGTFLETFDGTPGAPEPWNATDWDVFTHSRDRELWTNPAPVDAHHGPACTGVTSEGSDPGLTHIADSYDELVYLCNNHVMTTIDGGEYGLIYLTPPARLDATTSGTLSFDISTLATSTRDWWDVWITPEADALAYPLDAWIPDGQGPPRTALHVIQTHDGGTDPPTGPEDIVISVELCRDFVCERLGFIEDPGMPPTSAAVRSPVSITLTPTSVHFDYAGKVLDATFPSVAWGVTVVKLGHHSYNPFKDGGGNKPGSWHWDTVKIEPAVDVYQAQATPKRSTSPGTLTLAGPAPAGAHLSVGAVCTLQVDLGAGWIDATRAPQSTHAADHVTSYRHPIPAGATSVPYRFTNDGWWETGLGCLIENPVVVAG